MFANKVHGLQAVLTLSHDVHVIYALEQVRQLVARELFIIDNNRRERHSTPANRFFNKVYRVQGKGVALGGIRHNISD